MQATTSLLGLYNADNSIFDLMQLPEAIERDVLVPNLLAETAELEILYADPDFMKQMIGVWSQKQLGVWTELYDTTQYVYNPIWNKDGTITDLETRDLAATEDVTDNMDRVDNLEDKNTRNLSDTNSRDVYGYNSATPAPESKETASGTGTNTFGHTGRQDVDHTIDRDTTDTGTIKHEITEQGNIGVTSTQQLIQEQRELVKFNLIDYIIADFVKRFCIMVY